MAFGNLDNFLRLAQQDEGIRLALESAPKKDFASHAVALAATRGIEISEEEIFGALDVGDEMVSPAALAGLLPSKMVGGNPGCIPSSAGLMGLLSKRLRASTGKK